ncbi:hypothetical protein HDU78_009782 [Chytriomyces hyalinus]|nr:hypothetical protein HDU78_009782 [Chytriomyces hyalinus]
MSSTNQDTLAAALATASTASLAASEAGSESSNPATPSKRKVNKCSFGCGAAAVKTVGTCRYCSQNYCSKHRLPESHACANLQSCQSAAKDSLAKRLINEKTVGSKVAMA